MKALVVEQAGGNFETRSLAKPTPRSGEVLVRVHAAAVNPLDIKIRAGAAGHAKQPLPAVLGLDMAGEVESVGQGVTGFSAGDGVYGMVGGVGGRQGTLAEYVCVPQALLAPKPRALTMRQAAALPLVTITAWEGLIDRAQVQAGQTVLVHAGAGGVGHIVVQLAKAYGAKVFATVSSEKSHVVEGLGATPIDYRSASVEQYLQQHTSGLGFDVVYDTLGGPTLDASFLSVKKYTGHVVSCLGWGTHALAPLSLRAATYSGVFTLMPMLTGQGQEHHGEILRQAADLAEAGKLRPILASRVFGPEETADAFAAVAAGTLGKVVVDLVNWT
jgi:NADPH:quinone reductase